MRFEAKTLEEVYQKVSEYYDKSVSELDIKVIQSPSKGIFGFFSKLAIVEVNNEILETEKTKQEVEPKTKNVEEKIEQKDEEITPLTIQDVQKLVQKEINELFDLSCFDVKNIDVKIYDDETLLFEIDGEDSALLIGKEGYRYNALATMIFTWISQKYGYKTRLEIASFLENQEEMMRKFLEPTIREIEQKGRCKTKSFDGVLVYIALKILREEFPHKYVAIKTNKDGTKYIIVNDFLRKNG